MAVPDVLHQLGRSGTERRLSIDMALRIDDEQSLYDGSAERAVAALLRLNNVTAAAVEVSASHP